MQSMGNPHFKKLNFKHDKMHANGVNSWKTEQILEEKQCGLILLTLIGAFLLSAKARVFRDFKLFLISSENHNRLHNFFLSIFYY